MEVMIPSPPVDFNFESACTSPYVSAPSSPTRFGNYFFSAPTSPTRASAFYNEFSLIGGGTTAASGGAFSAIPFNWEEKPGVPKRKEETHNINNEDEQDFAFDFSGHLEKPSLSADELFDGGKIKPLKPPPRLQFSESGVGDSPKSPKSPKKMLKKVLSRPQKNIDFDTFSAAIEQTPRVDSQNQRGRERSQNSSNSNARQKESRSLSPYRVSDILFDEENKKQSSNQPLPSSSTSTSWYSKWKLKNFLLFRSASEGHAPSTSKDPLKKFGLSKRSSNEDLKNSSFRSTESSGSLSSRRRTGPVSAHELHYTVNRAVSEEMRRKTFLPYKQGLLGCLGFSPGGVRELSGRFGSSILTRH